MDTIFQRPYGCFEQTSSTTYPNVLALDYMRQTKKNVPEVEAKAQQYLHLGYQRLLSFEVAGGGFDWFGRPPANRTLTAYGLMEFEDMARVHDVDPALIARTRQWLLGQRQANGSWEPEGHMLHEDPATGRGGLPGSRRRRTSAGPSSAAPRRPPIAGNASVPARQSAGGDRRRLRLALVANALLAPDRSGTDATPYLDRLEGLKRSSADEKTVWWDGPAGYTMFYGAGRSGSVETTSLAALAMLGAGYHPATAHGALKWLVGQRDGNGGWYSTQATVLALKALLAAAGKPLTDGRPQHIELRCDGNPMRDLLIPAAQADVVQQIDVSSLVARGRHRLTIIDRSGAAAVYQVTFRYHLPGPKAPATGEALSIQLAYDKTNLMAGDTVGVTASVVNKSSEAAPMVILDLPVPAGFAVEPEDLEKLVAAEEAAKYQLTPRSANRLPAAIVARGAAGAALPPARQCPSRSRFPRPGLRVLRPRQASLQHGGLSDGERRGLGTNCCRTYVLGQVRQDDSGQGQIRHIADRGAKRFGQRGGGAAGENQVRRAADRLLQPSGQLADRTHGPPEQARPDGRGRVLRPAGPARTALATDRPAAADRYARATPGPRWPCRAKWPLRERRRLAEGVYGGRRARVYDHRRAAGVTMPIGGHRIDEPVDAYPLRLCDAHIQRQPARESNRTASPGRQVESQPVNRASASRFTLAIDHAS